MIWTIQVLLWSAFCDDVSWEATIEIDSNSNLDDLHSAIQTFVGFDNDHSYEFYSSRNERSKRRSSYSEDDGSVYDITLERLYPLEKGNSLFYLFDYGDQWLFKVKRKRNKPFEDMKNEKYPKLIEESGSKPIQYSEI